MIDKVRELVALGYGRRRMAKELGISERKVRTFIIEAKKSLPTDYHTKEESKDQISVEIVSDRLYTEAEMAAFHNIDLNIWEPAFIKTNYWEMGAKMPNSDGTSTLVTKPLHQLKVTWKRKELSTKEFEKKREDLIKSYQCNFLSHPKPKNGDYQTWIAMGCVHVPYHNKWLWNGVLSYLNDHKVDGLILAGDFLDMKSLSSYDSDKVFDITLSDEYIAGISAKKDLESVIGKDATKVYIAGNHECFSSDTELLTDRGWIDLNDFLKNGAKTFASYNVKTRSIEYVEPESVIVKEYHGDLHHWESSKCDILVTPNHQMLYYKQKDEKSFFSTSEEIIGKCVKFRISAINNNAEYAISDDEIRLAAWCYSDGGMNKNSGKWTIYQSKPPYVDDIRSLLDRMGLNYTETVRDRDIKSICGKKLKRRPLPNYEFRIKNDLSYLISDRINLDAWVYKLSKRQSDLFIKTIINGNGSRHKSSPDTSWMLYGMKSILEDVQLLCINNGHSCSLSTYRNNQYRININVGATLVKLNSVKDHSNSKKIKYSGLVWCATTANNTVISRRKGKVTIQGNCRYNKYMSSLQNARLGSALPSPYDALQMDDWKILPNWQEDYFLLGNDLEVMHGTITSQNAASAQLAKSAVNSRSALFFHTHRFQMATTGKYSAWNCGTLCDIDNLDAFGYVNRHIRQSWQNGFAIVTVDEDGETYVQPVKCGRKSFFLDGKKY